MAKDVWYYEKDDEQHGPVSQVELQALIESGEITRDNLAWRPGEKDWSETGSIEVLIPSFPTPPPVKPKAERPRTPPPPPPSQASPSGSIPNQEASGPPPTPPEPQPAATVQPILQPSLTISVAPNPKTEAPVQNPTPPKPPRSAAPFAPAQQPPPPPTEQAARSAADPRPDSPPDGRPGRTDETPPKPKPLKKRRSLFQMAIAFLVAIWRAIGRLPPIQQFASIALALALPSTAIYIVLPDSCGGRNDDPADPVDDPPAIVETSLRGTRVPLGYTGPVGQIKIDAYPWAELIRLSGPDGDLDVPGRQTTPLVLLVAPGSYRIELSGDKSCDVTVAVEQSRLCTEVVRPVDAAAYYREVGW